ncbi:SatD family protein [Micrococcus luteus]|uniref:SatD family protein n=1 Tax=Micrococcus luteus TaxID=1270 RepID=UPI003879D379
MTRAPQAAAVIADIVGSRRLPDREGAQEQILAAFAAAEQAVPPLRPAWASVGDEFQALHRTWEEAVRATARVSLALPPRLEVRFGIGLGERRVLDDGGGDGIEDGTAWYRAREAVERAHARADGAATAFAGADPSLTAAVDGLVLLRDHVIGRLKARERRLAAALLAGATQTEAARAERITQSAVSQAVARSGIDRLLELDAGLAAAPGGDARAEGARR